MSGDLDIRGGGAVAVDTASLRSVADRFAAMAAELEEVCMLVASAASLLFAGERLAWPLSQTVEGVRLRVRGAGRAADEIHADLRDAAAVYETIELRAERDIAASAGDTVALRRLQRELAALAREYPDAAAAASGEVASHWMRWPHELSAQAPGALWWINPAFFALAGPTVWGLQRAIGAAGAGTISRADRLRGPAPAVVVSALPARVSGAAGATGPVTASPAAVAPSSLAAAATRIPRGADARIRVEAYTMGDGTRQFAVYVAGTQTTTPNTGDPFDMASNVELYTGERSASYEATLAALTQSGAEPGDVVHAFGHSQGAMVAAHLGLEGGFDTQTLITFGSPVEADIGDQTLSVALRHRDDPVAALAAGGHASAVGAPGSFIAERTADPAGGLHDWRLPAHGIHGYAETATMLDESSDPRMRPVRAVFESLAGAESVEVVEYSAERVLPESAPFAPIAPVPPGAPRLLGPVSPSSAVGG